MRHFCKPILCIALLHCAVITSAQESVPPSAGERFPHIQASLEDGFYTLAEQQARGILRDNPKSAEANEAAVLLAHALWGQKRYSEMIDLLKDGEPTPGRIYWLARAHFELKEYALVLGVLSAGQDELDGSVYAPAALRLKGRTEIFSEKWEAAGDTFRLFAEAYPDHPDAMENRFDLAEVYLGQGRTADARAVYEKIAADGSTRDGQRARLKLARMLFLGGNAEDVESARQLLENLSADAVTLLAYRIDAYVELAALEEMAGNTEASTGAMRKAIALSPDANQRVPLKLSLARMLLRADDTAAALKLLEECRTEAPNATIAAELQLEKAGALLQAERYEEADAAYQVYLDVSNDPLGQAAAYFGKGMALSGSRRYAESATFFDKADKAFFDPKEKSRALFKAGDAYYQAGQFADAEKRYRAFVVGYPAHPDMPNALYQLGLTLAEIGRRSEAMTTFAIVESSHPKSPFAEKAALRSADILRASGQWEDALAKYTQIDATYTNSTDVLFSRNQRGLVLYQLGRYAEAQEVFELLLEQYPDSKYAPQASYMRGFCLYYQGHLEDAVKTCREFVSQYPDSVWTPEVMFWLGEHYFNQGLYAEADPQFIRIAEDFSGHRLAPRALYWAGRAAAAQSDYLDAIERYSTIARNYPASDVLPQTRFAQGDALTQLGEFSRAILAFEEIIKNYPESGLVNAAWGRKADCQFSLAADNPERYQEAIKSYQAILDRPTAPAVLKMQAEYAIGRCLEKTGLFEKAFSRYMNVVYTFFNDNMERTPPIVTWFTRAAFAAASLKEQEPAMADAVRIYQRVVDAGVPASEEAKNRIEKIKMDNWLLFQQAEETDDVGSDD